MKLALAGADGSRKESAPSGMGRPSLAALRSDPFVLTAVALLVVISGWGATSLFGGAPPGQIVSNVFDLLFLLLTAAAALAGTSRAEPRPLARFWGLVVASLLIWAGIEFALIAGGDVLRAGGPRIVIDSAYLLSYLLLLLATRENREVAQAEIPLQGEQRLLDRAVLVVFCIAILVYLVIIPGTVNQAAFDTLRPSFTLYFLLDVLIAGRFVLLSARAHSWEWRTVGRLMALAWLGWAVFDGVDVANKFGAFHGVQGPVIDLAWFLPFVLVVAAARLRRPFAAVPPVPASEPARTGMSGLPVLVAVLLPLLHFAGYAAGLLDEASRGTREVVLLIFLVAMAVLIVAERAVRSAALRVHDRLEKGQRLEAAGRMTAGVAHDFGNVLQVISTATDLLALRLDEDDRRKAQVEEIRRAVRRGSELTRKLAAFSSNQPADLRPLHINALLMEVEPLLRQLAGEEVHFVLDLEPAVGWVRADAAQLQQVVANLVANARDALSRGGVVTIATRVLDGGERPVERGANSHRRPGVRLVVRDNGVGMPPEVLEHAFEPFFTTKPVGRGSGLGLSVAYGIVSRAGGRIHIASGPEQGTEVMIDLPAVPPPDEDEVGSQTSHSRKATVLLADDDVAVRRLLRQLLESRGFEVLAAASADEALALAQGRAKIDVLVTDLVMPGFSGRDLARALVRMFPEVRVLLISGYAPHSMLEVGEGEEAWPLLQKPFTPETLLREVDALIGGRAS
ncbi:MAG: ATP-binding protein [Acidobacteriota bacterium]